MIMTAYLALVVEDDENLAEIFSLSLQAAGYNTEISTDGQQALARLAEIVPDLIVLDLNLPHVSGREILRAIRSNSRLARTRVILATAEDRQADFLSDQADLTLLKPISPGQLSQLAARLRPKPV
jgi:CheY-like chemotaxis protein